MQNIKAKEAELADVRERYSDVEKRLSKDQRQLQVQETQYRDQLTERNTLLLTVYQYLEKILGADKTPVRLLGIDIERDADVDVGSAEENLRLHEAAHQLRALPRGSHGQDQGSELPHRGLREEVQDRGAAVYGQARVRFRVIARFVDGLASIIRAFAVT